MDSSHTCLTVISFVSAFNKDGSYYLPVFLKGCKYIEKRLLDKLLMA